jgi:hypothetical protein
VTRCRILAEVLDHPQRPLEGVRRVPRDRHERRIPREEMPVGVDRHVADVREVAELDEYSALAQAAQALRDGGRHPGALDHGVEAEPVRRGLERLSGPFIAVAYLADVDGLVRAQFLGDAQPPARSADGEVAGYSKPGICPL